MLREVRLISRVSSWIKEKCTSLNYFNHSVKSRVFFINLEIHDDRDLIRVVLLIYFDDLVTILTW